MPPFKRRGRFFVYMVQCNDGSFYTGFTTDLENRVALHNAGQGAKYTRAHRPVTLVWWREYRYFRPAFLAEARIKTLPRSHKQKMIARMARRKPG